MGFAAVSVLGVVAPFVEGLLLILGSERMASLVENILVSRFVIEGFSAAAVAVEAGAADLEFCGSAADALVCGAGW